MNIEPRTIKVENEDYNIRNYINYAQGVLNGEIVAGRLIKLACKRFLDRFNRDDMYFDVADVDKRIIFISKLKHTTGQHFGHRFKLLDWQQFCVANIFGWKWKDTGLRVTQNVMIFVSRKNGKTALAAAICLASIICDGEHDAEVDLVANNARQSGIALKHIQMFIKNIDPGEKLFKRYRNEVRIPSLESNIQCLAADAMGLDGYSASVCILDEFHAQKTFDIYNVMRSSMGARQNPLMICITTAGFLIGDAYPCYSMWKTHIEILENKKQDDSVFSAIFQLDDNDDYEDKSTWTKFCPSLNQTVFESYIETELNSSRNNTALQGGVKTKTCNMWCQSESIWLPNVLIEQQMQSFTLEQLRDKGADICYIGVDLAAVSDLTSISVCVPFDGKFYIKSWAFLPEDCLKEGINCQIYRDFARRGELIVTPGNVTDYDFILDKIMEIDKVLTIQIIDYDAFNATQFAINATNLGLPMQPFSQALGHFNRFTKEFERQLRLGNIILDKSTLTQWCFANTTLMRDKNDNCKPTKGDSKNNKIDIVISAIQSFAGAIYNDSYFNVTVVE